MENGNQTKRQVGMEKLKEMFSLISRFLVLPLFQDPPRIAPLCPRYLITGVATPFFVSLFCFGLSRRQKGPRSIRLLATGCWWRWWWQNLPGNGAGTADAEGGCDDGFVLRYFFIGPRSDHSLLMSVTHWLTNSLTTLLKIEWFDLNMQTTQTT